MLAGGVADRASASDALRVADVAGVARAACVDPACASKWLRNRSAVALKPRNSAKCRRGSARGGCGCPA